MTDREMHSFSHCAILNSEMTASIKKAVYQPFNSMILISYGRLYVYYVYFRSAYADMLHDTERVGVLARMDLWEFMI